MNVVKTPISYRTSNTELVIWWETDSGITVGHGAEVYVGSSPAFSVVASTSMVMDAKNQAHAVHKIELLDLEPDSSVTIRIKGPEYYGTVQHSFHTPAISGPRVIGVINSPEGFFGSSNPNLGYMLSQMGTVDFYVSCGGIQGKQPTYETWTKWYNDVSSWVGATGMLAARSSSDAYPRISDKLFPVTLVQAAGYYSASVGNIRFVVLDTSIAGRRGLAGDQRDWALNEFNSPSWKLADFRLILIGDPFRVSLWDQSRSFGDGTGTDKFLLANLFPLLEQSGADLVLAGRVHSYQRGAFATKYPNHEGNPTYYVACGGMAPAHVVDAWDWDVSDPPGITVSSSDQHFVTLSVDSSNLRVICKKLGTGTTLDEVEIAAHTLY